MSIELSVVVPAFNEAENVGNLYRELVPVLEAESESWEIIYSDDGSSDGTWQEILQLRRQDERVKGIRLSRNFGHQYALFAGLCHAAGRAVVSLDADLQHPPDVIPRLMSEWRIGARIVQTVRVDPPDFSAWKRFTSRMFYRVFSFLSGVEMSPGMADFRLLDRQVVDAIREFREEGLFLRGLVQWMGFDRSVVTYQSRRREKGQTKYTLYKMLQFSWRGITSFSIKPLRVGIILGVCTGALAFAQLAYAVYSKLVTGAVVPGWASAVGIVSLLFGIMFILVGLIGEYLGRVLIEVRGRPRFLMRDIVGIPAETRGDRNEG